MCRFYWLLLRCSHRFWFWVICSRSVMSDSFRLHGLQHARPPCPSLTQWTWVWVDSGSWWWTGRPGMLQFMRSQTVGHDWATELNWNCLYSFILVSVPPPRLLVCGELRSEWGLIPGPRVLTQHTQFCKGPTELRILCQKCPLRMSSLEHYTCGPDSVTFCAKRFSQQRLKGWVGMGEVGEGGGDDSNS